MIDNDEHLTADEETGKKSDSSVLFRIARWSLAMIGLCVVLGIIGFQGPVLILHAAYLIVAGWIHFLFRVGPEISWNPAMIGSSIFVLVLAIIGLHLVIRHFRKNWQLRGTFAFTGLIGVLFAAAIAVTGIVHQSIWLAKGEIVSSGWSGYSLSLNMSNVRQLMLALRTFEEDNGMMPTSIYELYPEYIDVDPKSARGERFWYFQAEDGSLHEWLYFPEARQLAGIEFATAENEQPICLASPLGASEKAIACYISGSVRAMKPEDLRTELSTYRDQWLKTESPATSPASSSPP